MGDNGNGESAAKRRCADLVDAYFTIQETRKRLDLREQAMTRDEIILIGEKKACGKILDETGDAILIKTTEGKERNIKREEIRRVIRARFETVEEAQAAIYRWPMRNRTADISSTVFLGMENDVKKELGGVINEWPVWTKWLKNIKGIGPVTAAGIWAHVDIRIASTVSKLWHFAGHHLISVCEACGIEIAAGQGVCPKCGEKPTAAVLPHLKKGERRSWNRRLQTIVWNGGESIVRTKGGYRDIYDQFKAEELEDRFDTCPAIPGELAGLILAEEIGKYKAGTKVANSPQAKRIIDEQDRIMGGRLPFYEKDEDGSLMPGPRRRIKVERAPGHIDRRARRKMRKVFLGHLWQVWRGEEGLPITPVYIIGKDGHNREIPIPSE